jgi:hypothetical protein
MRQVLVGCALSLIVLAASSAFVTGKEQTSGRAGAVAEITKIENDGIKAGIAGDPSWTQKYLAADYTGGPSQGTWDTKASLLADLKDAANNSTKSQTLSDLKVRVHGDLGLATYSTTYDAMYKGKHYARTVLCTDTFQHQSAGWMLMASHCSDAAK